MLNSALSSLRGTVGAAFAIQAACAAVAIPLQTEKFYDLSGSLTFISCTFLSLYWNPLRAHGFSNMSKLPALTSFHPRQLIMSGFCVLWAGRLGSFLFQRVHKAGSDSRFDEIKKSPTKFAGAWFMQGLWVSLTALPVFAVNAIPAHLQPCLGARDALGAALWLGAFAYEVTADRQKSAWRKEKEEKKHEEKFISRGLWAQSRHPNYVGEVSLWAAQYILSTTALSSPLVAGPLLPAWLLYGAVVSPVLEFGLIRFISGVPLLEASGDKKFKGDPKWEEYKRNTPVFFPKLF